MSGSIEEFVTVAAVFGGRPPVKPVWFIWRNRKYRILRITYSWIDRQGRAVLHHFAVSDGANLYELCFDSERLSWRLMATDPCPGA